MLKSIFNAIKTISKSLTKIIEIVFDFVEDLLWLVDQLAEITLGLPQYIGWLPSLAITTITSIIGIVVIFRVLGRD